MDNFFTWFTLLGDGVVAFLLLGWFLIRRSYLQGIHILAAFISSGIVAQVIKQFSHMPRPRVYLQAGQYQHFIEGITRGGWSSFPSGHTATAFALATILALHSRNKWAGLLYLLLAISVGYSRIYLGHHFLEDVLAGSIIGVGCAGWVYIAMPELRIFGRRIGGEPSLAPLVIHN
ncbi:phosphatase PAP2 family protein [Paraflavitalea speifideaquila]|uniref:phosphatase PAP2 family protein n=1 Tax=Paraflavitalea speifideaquila TaxID=3076558 RepID=UPI0028E5D0BF|nr:phosphatase PAP2 family protein [Paraflavitalea speifideiaquila]